MVRINNRLNEGGEFYLKNYFFLFEGRRLRTKLLNVYSMIVKFSVTVQEKRLILGCHSCVRRSDLVLKGYVLIGCLAIEAGKEISTCRRCVGDFKNKNWPNVEFAALFIYSMRLRIVSLSSLLIGQKKLGHMTAHLCICSSQTDLKWPTDHFIFFSVMIHKS